MYYDKRIRYIDYLENGEKRRNCGYVKMTVAGGSLLMEMQIKGLYETDDVASEIILEGAGPECRIGTVVIRQGSGNFCREFRDPEHEGEKMVIDRGMTYGQLMRIVIQLSPRRSLRCIWREAKQAKTAVAEAAVTEERTERAAGTAVPEEQPESVAEAAIPEEQPESVVEAAVLEEQPESVAEAAVLEEQSERAAETAISGKRPERAAEAVISEELAESVAGEKAEMDVTAGMQKEEGVDPQEELHTAETPRQSIPEPAAAVLCEDKWQQLQMIYPHIYPFQDERGYLSLRPEDFVILSSNAYRLVRNSFLLHGYYNYEHLILTNVSYRGADQYYIGVPGNFYEKEKQVAIMYGFNRFECKREPAEEGDFGYYMIRVEL